MSNASTFQAPIQRVGVLGAGQMGVAAAVMFARAGFEVQLWARNASKLQNVRPSLDRLEAFLSEHFGTPKARPGTIQLEPHLQTVDSSADAVLECIVEDLTEKRDFLRKLAGCRKRGALVMSCTSALRITDLSEGTGLETQLVGTHFWNPPHLIPAVEVIPGARTYPETLQRAMDLLHKLGKIPVPCADVPGFIGNRLMHAMWREALSMVESGMCTPEAIDQIVKYTFALRLPALGPMENMDLVGLKLVERVERYLFPYLTNPDRPSKALTDRIEKGQTGMDAGQGFYDWKQRNSSATIELRDKQIVRQLQFLMDSKAL